MRKPLLITLVSLLAVLAVALGGLLFTWSKFEFQPMLNSTITTDQTDPEKVCVLWLDHYFDQFSGWRVPYGWKARHARVDSLEDLGDGFFQLDYSVYIPRGGDRLIDALYLYPAQEAHFYQNQVVIRWEQSGLVWRVAEEMRPAAWQLAYDPDIQAERNQPPEPEHYLLPEGETCGYLVLDGVFYVTYDGGDTLVEVPDGYEKICNTGSGRYNERLCDNGWVVTPELTAFLTFTYNANLDQYRSWLLYSRDMGQTWQETQIADFGYQGNTFLSLTETGLYAAFPADRGLGSDYYAIFFSADLETWNQIPLSGHTRNFTCVFWPEEGTGYLSGCEVQRSDGSTLKNTFFMTRDNGESYEMMEYPIVEEFVNEWGYFPFDTVEKMYARDGLIYMVVGQGDDGDYYEDGVRVSALYQSEGGENFTFVQTVDNTRKLYEPG